MEYKSNAYTPSANNFPFWSRGFSLLLAGTLALLLSACGGSNGGNNGTASANEGQCNLNQDQIDALQPGDALPPECDFLRVPPLVGLFILGTEIDAEGDLKLYVNGVKQNGTPMTLTDFEGAAVTVGGVTVDPANWDVIAADGGVLSLVTLADYSASISTADLIGMGDLYDVVLNNARPGFEAETINFSSDPATLNPVIAVKPVPGDHWTTNLPDLLAANDYDAAFPNENTPLYDAMATGLMGPIGIDEIFNPDADDLGLVERDRPATLLMGQSDGVDNASVDIDEEALVSLMDRCHTTAIMLGTFQLGDDIDQILEGRATLERLAGTRGAFVNALNSSFLEEAITPFSESLGNLVVFTVSRDTLFAEETVRIEVDNVGASEAKPFDIPADCQIPGWAG